MTTPLIDRLLLLVKQLNQLNEILKSTLSALPESLHASFNESITIELSGIKENIKRLHTDINSVMSTCYRQSLESIRLKCNADSQYLIKTSNKKLLND